MQDPKAPEQLCTWKLIFLKGEFQEKRSSTSRKTLSMKVAMLKLASTKRNTRCIVSSTAGGARTGSAPGSCTDNEQSEGLPRHSGGVA